MKNKVWILDDDPFITKAIKAVLERDGHVVLSFDNFNDLKHNLKQETPHLMLLDVLLNAEDGLSISRKIKETKKYSAIPIVLISANNLLPEKIVESKADAFLKKPFELNDLRQTVLHFLNNN